MNSKNVIITTVLYQPIIIFHDTYLKLINLGYSLEIWCNSILNDEVLEKLNHLELHGAKVYRHYENQGLRNVINFYFKKKCEHFLFFIDQDTKINPELFDEFLQKNREVLNSNFLTYSFNKQKPKFFFTNSGSFFNLKESVISVPNYFFVELVDYFILFKILEKKLNYIFIEVDFIDHYGFQNNISANTGKKIYSFKRKNEVLISSLLLCFMVLISTKLNLKHKMKLLYHTFKNTINIFR